MKKVVLACAAIAVAVVVFFLARKDVEPVVVAKGVDAASRRVGEEAGHHADERMATVGRDVLGASQAEEDEAASEDDSDSEENEEPQTEEEKREAAEEQAVDAFDDLTDKWQEPSVKGVTMSDIDHFAKQFRQVPKARQDECVHRALNLIPDENVMLLAGILMDKSMDREIVETVFNDILNRDEDVKKPILQQIFKDKSHPCRADAAWILDATGELPTAR